MGEQPAFGAMGFPAQSQVAVQVGEQPAFGAIGRPAQSQVAVHVGEQVMGWP